MDRTPTGTARPVITSRAWFLRSYLRGLAGLGASLVLIFFAGQAIIDAFLQDLVLSNPIPPYEWVGEGLSNWWAIDIDAPVAEQFVQFVATRALHPWILGIVVVGAVVTVALTYRERRNV